MNLLPARVRTELAASPFLRHNASYFFGTLATSVLNYLFYPLMSRLLPPADFGEVQALMSLFLQATIFFSVLNYVTIHITVHKEDSERNVLLEALEHFAVWLGLGLTVITLLLVKILQRFLHFGSVWPFIALVAALLLTIPLSFRMAYLQGRKKFGQASVSNAIGSAAKIFLSAALVAVGWKSFGAMTGLALSQVISLYYAYVWARRAGLFPVKLRAKIVDLRVLKPQVTYALFVLVVSFTVLVVLSLDIIAVKHYFSPEQAGLYAGVATIARIVYFLTGPFTGVLLASVSLRQEHRKNRRLLAATAGLIACLGGLALLVIAAFPRLIVIILVGSKYLPYVYLLPQISLAMFVLSLCNLLLTYQLALRRYSFMGAVILGSAPFFWLLSSNHKSISSVVHSILYGSVILLIVTLVWSGGRRYLPRTRASYGQ